MLNQEKIEYGVLKKVSELITVDVVDIDIKANFDEVGLDSLSLAMLFIELEMLFGFDPLGEGNSLLSDIHCISDIIDIFTKNEKSLLLG